MVAFKSFTGKVVFSDHWPASNDNGGYTACELRVYKHGDEWWVEASSDGPTREQARCLSKPVDQKYEADDYDWLGGGEAEVFSELVERFVGTKIDETTYVCNTSY